MIATVIGRMGASPKKDVKLAKARKIAQKIGVPHGVM